MAGGAPVRNLHGASLVVQATEAREVSTRAAQDLPLGPLVVLSATYGGAAARCDEFTSSPGCDGRGGRGGVGWAEEVASIGKAVVDASTRTSRALRSSMARCSRAGVTAVNRK